jgi:hypothetical protein
LRKLRPLKVQQLPKLLMMLQVISYFSASANLIPTHLSSRADLTGTLRQFNEHDVLTPSDDQGLGCAQSKLVVRLDVWIHSARA